MLRSSSPCHSIQLQTRTRCCAKRSLPAPCTPRTHTRLACLPQRPPAPSPLCPGCWTPQGLYFEALGSAAEAEELYGKELEKDPNNGMILKRMVRAEGEGGGR